MRVWDWFTDGRNCVLCTVSSRAPHHDPNSINPMRRHWLPPGFNLAIQIVDPLGYNLLYNTPWPPSPPVVRSHSSSLMHSEPCIIADCDTSEILAILTRPLPSSTPT